MFLEGYMIIDFTMTIGNSVVRRQATSLSPGQSSFKVSPVGPHTHPVVICLNPMCIIVMDALKADWGAAL